jgi:hypothetical protein
VRVLRPAANPYAPTDGAYFRLSSSGLNGVINNNGTETTIALTNFTYVNNTVYKFLIVCNDNFIGFWIDDILYGTIPMPVAQAQPFMSVALPFSFRHAIVGGTAGGVFQANIKGYSISSGGLNLPKNIGELGNAMFGSYQGLSGGIMGSLASYPNSTNPVAAVPTNTTSTVLTALGGQGWETDTLAVTTDGIIMSYQTPATTANVVGKRLKLVGFKMSSYVQAALTGGGYNAQFSIAFGHTAVSLATAEGATTKAPRRIAFGSYSVPSGAVALTQLTDLTIDLSAAPIYVNPGEFIAVVKKKVGTAPSAGTIAYTFTPIYTWE